MPEVQISARIIHWPRMCACCCGRAETSRDATATRYTGKKIVRPDTRSWPVPYCRQCIAHQAVWAEIAGARSKLKRARSQRITGVCFVIVFIFASFFIPGVLFNPARNSATESNRTIGALCCMSFLLAPTLALIVSVLWHAPRTIRRLLAEISNLLDEVDSLTSPDCSARRQAVRYEEWHATVHTFNFSSREYIEAFERANAGKLLG